MSAAVKYFVDVPAELEPLMEKYLRLRQADIELLEKASVEKDFPTIISIAHKISGSAGGYGFHELGKIAQDLELAGRQKNLENIPSLIHAIKDHVYYSEIHYK